MLPAASARIRLLLLDVDGVLTDGGLRYGDAGEERKVFHAQDGHALRVAQQHGLAVGLVSGRCLPAVAARARELHLDPVLLGVADKLARVESLLTQRGEDWATTAFMGDDLPDLPCLLRSGCSLAPADASPLVRQRVDHITRARGGRGAVAEAIGALLAAAGRAPEVADATLHG